MTEQNKKRLLHYRIAIENYLEGCFTESAPHNKLFDAMRYSLLAGGKRIRPVLTLEFARLCGAKWEASLPIAAAIEMVHTYSLIHDDLPCMDNDDYRRGRLTSHKVYGEAVAVLAGDALLTAAFSQIALSGAAPSVIADCVAILADAAGERGMVGGQVLDMEGELRSLTAEEVYGVHSLKTGCLISAACCLGVAAAQGTAAQMAAARSYAGSLGLAFQIRDDMLDVLGDAEKLGKATHSDEKKTTFVDLYGIDGCARRVREETDKAIASLLQFDDGAFLTELAADMATRDH